MAQSFPLLQGMMREQRTVMFSKTGSLGATDAIKLGIGRTIWIADAHRDGKRYVVRADEKLTAFMELETAIPRCREKINEKTQGSVGQQSASHCTSTLESIGYETITSDAALFNVECLGRRLVEFRAC